MAALVLAAIFVILTHLNVGLNARSAMVANAIISRARSMERKAIADGVPMKEQLGFFTVRGYHIMQGSYYCSPILAGDFKQLLQVEALPLETLSSGRLATSISTAT